ncbi:hypothetical protein TWF281_001390 [Arthrobotrys megalospora]
MHSASLHLLPSTSPESVICYTDTTYYRLVSESQEASIWDRIESITFIHLSDNLIHNGSFRLRQKVSITESLNGARSGRSSQPLSKRPSFANSASGSLTGSQRNRLRECRAEAVFEQTTPFSTIRLIMARASEAPNAPAPTHLFRQLMEYFGTDDDQMMSIIQNQPKSTATSVGGGGGGGPIQQENSNPASVAATGGPARPPYPRSCSGTSTPGSEPTGDLSTRQLSNAEIMVYINTMLGNFPRRRQTPEGIMSLEELFGTKLLDGLDDGGSEYGYVSDCEPCDIDSMCGDDNNIDRGGRLAGGLEEGVEKLKVSGGMRLVEEDNDYDGV